MSDQPSSINVLQISSAYYPEYWLEERWAEEIHLMRATNLTVVRMAEFAWSTLEPTEGQFGFDWLERAIQKLAEAGIASVLGTPTAANQNEAVSPLASELEATQEPHGMRGWWKRLRRESQRKRQ